MQRLTFFFLWYTVGIFAAASQEEKVVGAVSKWGAKNIAIINCALPHINGFVVGLVTPDQIEINRKLKSVEASQPSMTHFDPVSFAKYFKNNIGTVMQEVKLSARPDADHAWCLQALQKLQTDFKKIAKERGQVERFRAMQLAFFLGDSCSVLYACNSKTAKAKLPPIQLIEFFSDIHEFKECILLLTADTIETHDDICEVRQFPSETHRPLSLLRFREKMSLHTLVDEVVPGICARDGRLSSVQDTSRAMVVSLAEICAQKQADKRKQTAGYRDEDTECVVM